MGGVTGGSIARRGSLSQWEYAAVLDRGAINFDGAVANRKSRRVHTRDPRPVLSAFAGRAVSATFAGKGGQARRNRRNSLVGGWHFLRGKSKTCSVLIMYRTCYSFFTSSIYRYFLAISDCIIVYN